MDFQAGRSRVTVVGGWLVDIKTSVHRYTTQESDPIYETTTETTHYSQKYLDMDGDVQTRRWSSVEEQTNQVGAHHYSVDREIVSATYRVAYDDGTMTAAASHPEGAGYGDRVHWYSIAHPLLRSPVQGRLYSMAVTRGHMTRWQRLVTLPARRAIGRAVEQDRRTLLGAVANSLDRGEERTLHHLVIDGTWDAARRRVRTSRGEHRIRNAGRIEDGATVGLLLRDRGFTLPFASKESSVVVDGWMTVTGRSWAGTNKPIIERLWQARVPSVAAAAALITAAVAIPLRSNPLLVLAGLTGIGAFLGFRGMADSRQVWLDRFHAGNVRHAMRILRRGYWQAAMHAARSR